MTKSNFFRYYNRYSGSDRYALVFSYNGNMYIADVPHIKPSWTVEAHESSSKGGYQKWRISSKVLPKCKLVKDALYMMPKAEFEAAAAEFSGTRGDYCEYWICTNLGATPSSSKRNERFDKCGDVTYNGLQYQVKLENASLTNVHVIHNIQRERRLAKKLAH